MKQGLQVELVKRVLAHVDAKTTDADPSGRTLEIGAYADGERMTREIGTLFRELPLMIAHVSDLPNAGDFLTHEASGTPLLVVRRDDGGVDAFLNVCRHRGTRVEDAPRGNKRAFSCPYHGWTYGRRGQLVTVPHERGFACIDKASRGLVRVAAGVASGFVFAVPEALAEGASHELDVRAWLGPLADDLEGFGTASAVAHDGDRRAVVRDISWKLAIDIFLETYHLRPTHKDSIYPMFFDNIGLVDRVGPHLRNVFPKRSIRELAGADESTWSLRTHANVLFHLFPNTLVLVQPDHAAVLNVWPIGPTRAQVASYLLIPERAESDKARGYWKANADILYGATDEDFAMGESIQRGLSSGANTDVVFASYEHALAHFHEGIARHTS
ncbi:MAG: Rieske 2Fe-2S domain-containing protein [Labilithrix sp.]|nr:Rieske 2Fe-2S domain-containing protein [Labilithrix sp.]MCW5816802.1 Rieske 2Fe-2S domain-containing protein [Labilithrix sp.]